MRYLPRIFIILFVIFLHGTAPANNAALSGIIKILLLNSASANSSSFITTWQTIPTDKTITLPLLEGAPLYSYNFEVNWGDGSSNTITAWDQAEKTHTYAVAGEYDVTITGTCETFTFNNVGDKDKLIDVKNWGNLVWKNVASMFYGCTNITTFSATDTPDLSNVTSFNRIFKGASNFNSDISNWDTNTITQMKETFKGASSFNQPLDSWDMNNVTDIGYMFEDATTFNQNLSSWNLTNLINANSVFHNCSNFNQDISNWNIGNVTGMHRILSNAGLSTANYDALLVGWEALTVEAGVSFGADGITYTSESDAETARFNLINNDDWIITDDGGTP